MNAQHSPVYQCRESKVIEDFRAVSPHICVAVFPLTFVVESVDLGDLPGFMIASEERYICWISSFEEHEEGEDLEGVVPAVNKIAHEDIAGVWDVASLFEEFEEVMELAVDVTADLQKGVWEVGWACDVYFC